MDAMFMVYFCKVVDGIIKITFCVNQSQNNYLVNYQ